MIKLNVTPLWQNVIAGTLLGSLMVYYLYGFDFIQTEKSWIWFVFLLVGPLLGFLSGIERQRASVLRKERGELSEDLEKFQGELKRSTQKFSLIFENMNDAVFLTTQDGRFVYFNQALPLYSGYDSAQLRAMRIDQLKMPEDDRKRDLNTWLDNGLYRGEEVWKTQDGRKLSLEVTARHLKFGKKQLVLHTARDIKQRKTADNDQRKKTLISSAEEFLRANTSSQHALYEKILPTQNQTIRLIKNIAEKNPDQKGIIAPLLQEWGKTATFLKSLMEKNARDLDTSMRQWNINTILEQELDYLDRLTPLNGFERKTYYSDDLPVVSGTGRELSLAFGTILKAALQAQESPKRKEIVVATGSRDAGMQVEIKAPGVSRFYEHLATVIDPGYSSQAAGEMRPVVDSILQTYFKAIGAIIKIVADPQKGVGIHISFPDDSKKRNLTKANGLYGLGKDEKKNPAKDDEELLL